ncbi:hypothetical protein SLS57_009796 [Botryosphaeria dothidea]
MAVNFQLTPLQQDMEIGKIRLELIQTRILVATKDGELWRSDKTLKTVASTVISLPANRKDRFPDHVDSLCESEIRDEALRFSINFGTSQGVYNRVQTVNHQKIKVKHVLQVTVDLIDPEGHSSKIKLNFFPKFYIPTEDGVHKNSPDVDDFHEGSRTPPPYTDHVHDMLCREETRFQGVLPAYEDV